MTFGAARLFGSICGIKYSRGQHDLSCIKIMSCVLQEAWNQLPCTMHSYILYSQSINCIPFSVFFLTMRCVCEGSNNIDTACLQNISSCLRLPFVDVAARMQGIIAWHDGHPSVFMFSMMSPAGSPNVPRGKPSY